MHRKLLPQISAALLLAAASSVAAHAESAAAHCASLAKQWDAAKVAKASSPDLGRAKVWAKSGAHDCARDNASHQQDGVDEYVKALTLLGVTPH